jgi:hypothetical protein
MPVDSDKLMEDSQKLLTKSQTLLSPTVKAGDLASPVTAPKLTEPVVGSIPSRTTGTVKNVATDTQNFITAQSAEQDRLTQLREEYKQLGLQGSLSDLSEQKQTEFGATPEALRELKDIQLQLSDNKTASELTKTKIEGAAGQTLSQAQREVTQEDREQAVRDAGLAARAAVLQGNIETARALAKDAVDIAFQDRSLKNQNLINQINDLQGVVDGQTAQLLEADKRKYEAEQAAIKELKENIASAMISGASQSEIARLNDPELDDASKLALAQAIIARGANQMRNLDIAAKEATIANTYDQIADRKARLDLAEKAAQLEIDKATATEEEVKQSRAEKALGMLSGLNELMNHPGLKTAVGTTFVGRSAADSSGVVGTVEELASGARSEFISEVERVANTLTLENMELLKGPATDKDVELVAASMSRLMNRDVSEDSYRKELTRIKEAMQRIVDNVGITPEQAQFWYGVDAESLNEANALWATTSANSTAEIGGSFDY